MPSVPCMWNKTVRSDGRHSTTEEHHNTTLTPLALQQRTHPAQTVAAQHHPLKGAVCHTVRKQEPILLQAPRSRNFSAPPHQPHILLTRIPEHSQNLQHDRWVAWRLGCSISYRVRERVDSQNALNLTNTRYASYTIQMRTGRFKCPVSIAHSPVESIQVLKCIHTRFFYRKRRKTRKTQHILPLLVVFPGWGVCKERLVGPTLIA